MKFFLAIWGIISFLGGILTLPFAKSAFQEIGGYILFLMSAVCFASSSIIKNLEVICDLIWEKNKESKKSNSPLGTKGGTDWVKEID